MRNGAAHRLLSRRSHPSRGAWIEMPTHKVTGKRQGRRTPHGVRGLKLDDVKKGLVVLKSHPSRGAWIEIVLPLRAVRSTVRRTPHGVRGLKYAAAAEAARRYGVAPLTGCVD